jgi:mono/diheme cytochrome c family protein
MSRHDSRNRVRRLLWVTVGATVLGLLAITWMVARQLLVPALPPVSEVPAASPQTVERGAYLAQLGNCAACHTVRGSQPYAGGRAIDTPFGAVYASNLTPDAATGLGLWSADAFWRAMHHGQSRDGRLLYPAFPYTDFTQITRDDSDALFAFLRSQPAVSQPNRPHALRWPYRTQAALAVWRELYFEPAGFAPASDQTPEWNRGAYLVHTLGHCATCHSPRNALGGVNEAERLTGGVMPGDTWYAPSLRSTAEAGLADWTPQQVVALLRTGMAQQASVMGPMAEVVFESTQHLNDADAHAMATYLMQLAPQDAAAAASDFKPADSGQMELGEQVYTQNCADCHGQQGEGAAGAYPALAGNRAVVMASHINSVQAILSGGFAPSTAGHPQPYGMPPFRTLLTDAEIAAVSSFIRQRWGNRADAVRPLDVQRLR